MLLMHTGAIQPKTTRNTQGVAAMTLRKGGRLLRAVPYAEGMLKKPDRYREEYPCTGRAAHPGGDRRGTADTVIFASASDCGDRMRTKDGRGQKPAYSNRKMERENRRIGSPALFVRWVANPYHFLPDCDVLQKQTGASGQ